MGSILKYRALEPIFKVHYNNGVSFDGCCIFKNSLLIIQIQKLLDKNRSSFFQRLLITVFMVFAVNYAHSVTYYSRGSLAPNLTTSWAINTDGSGSQPTNFTTAGDIFTIQNGHSMTMGNNWAVTGNVVINNGGTLTAGAFTITISGTTTIGSGTSGTLNITSATGNKNFYGLVTINSGATWNNSANEAVTFRGGITNNGTFTAGTGVHTFDTNVQTISGTISIPSVTVTGVTLTNNENLTVSSALTGTGELINSDNCILNIGNTISITTLTATADGNTVNYYRSGNQTAKVTTYNNLTISGSNTKTFATSPTVNGILSMEGTAGITVTTGVVTYGANATLKYNKPAAYSATSEEWITTFSGTGGVLITNTGAITTNSAKTLSAGVPLTINSGSQLITGATNTWTLTVGGTTTVSGTLTLANTGVKTFTGEVTVNANGVWNNTGNSATSFAGGIIHNGITFNNGTGAAAFSTTQSIAGSGNMTFGGSVTPASGATLTNNNSGILTINNLVLTGNFLQGSNNPTLALINATPFSGSGIFDANTNTNTVNYSGAAQTGKVTTYNNLTISGTGLKTFATTPTVNGILSMEQTGTITVTTGAVTYGANATLQYNKPAAYTATLKEWPATFSGSGGVKIINTGVITFGGAKVITNNLSIGTGSSVNLGTLTTHTASSLTLGGSSQSCGTWGYGPGTPPANKNQTFFANTSGYIMVGTIPAAPTSVTPSSGIEICSGDGTYLNATSAGNTINWYTTPTGGTSIGSSASGADFYVSPAVNTTYYAETQNAGGCVSATRTATGTISVNTQITKNYLDIPNSSHSTVCATAAENNNVVISAPAGNFFVGVDFASYGTPNGICESFTIGGCHAATSMSVCEGYLLGNSSATIPATNGVFTDPCVGTVKRLYVQAVYNSTQFEICEGSLPGTITGSVPAGGNGTYTYLWESSTTNSSGGFVPASGTNNSKDYTPGALTQTTWFRRTVTSGGCSSTSFAVEITVNPAIAITNPGAQIACDSYTLPAIAGTNLSGNQKYYNNSQALGGSVITGAVSTTQTVWIYDNDGICSDEESFLVTIIGKPLIDPISAVSTLCAGGTVNSANPAVTANGSSVTSQGWQIETTAGGGVFGSLTLPYTVSSADNGKKIRFYATNSCGTAYSNEVTLSVTPLPTITTQPSPLILCEGESGNLSVITSSPSPTYQWQYSNNPTGPWNITNGVAGVSGHTTNQLTITDVPIGYNNFYVSCIITSNSCSIQSDAVLITVNPVPVTGEIIPD